MPTPPAADDAAAVTPPSVGDVKLYPVGQPDGSTRQQLVLIVTAPDDSGSVRGRALCYLDETGQFQPDQFTA